MAMESSDPHVWEISLAISSMDDYCLVFDECDDYLTKHFGRSAWEDLVLEKRRVEPNGPLQATSTIYGLTCEKYRRQFELWCVFKGIQVVGTSDPS